jgi:AcrR family transcriptional regulator
VPSLDAICARAGYTRGAFYVHFRDRDDFVVAVMESLSAISSTRLIGAGEGSGSLDETVLRFARALVEGNPLTGPSGSMRTHHLIDVCTRSEKIRERFLAMLAEAERRVANAAGRRASAPAVCARTFRPRRSLPYSSCSRMGVVQAFELGMPLRAESVRESLLLLLAPPRRSPSRS